MKMIRLKNMATSMVSALVLGCGSGRSLEERVNDGGVVVAEDAPTPKLSSDDASNSKWYQCPEQQVEDCVERSDSWEIVAEPELLEPLTSQYTIEECHLVKPSFSPDGSKILYVTFCILDWVDNEGTGWGFYRLKTIDLDSGEKRTILDAHNSTFQEMFYWFWCSRWSPAGEYIALTGHRDNIDARRGVGFHDELALTRPDGTDFRTIAGQSAASDYDCEPNQYVDDLSCPSWSPEGDRLVIKRKNDHSRIEIYNLNGNRVIVPNPSCDTIQNVEWGKDGYIYFIKREVHGSKNDGLYVMNPDNMVVEKISESINYPLDSFGFSPYDSFVLSPDATKALYFNTAIDSMYCNNNPSSSAWCPSTILDLCNDKIYTEDNICSKQANTGCFGPWLGSPSWHPFLNVITGVHLSGELITYKLPCSLLFPVPPLQPPIE